MTGTPAIVLCPGQGAQAVGMGKAWYDAAPEARAVFDQADRLLGTRLGAPITQLCFTGPTDRLNQTDVSQPAIYVTSIACWKAILAKRSMGNGEQPLAAAAGLSLGEYTALTVAGSLTFEDGLELVTLRGRAMQDAADSPEARTGGGGGMLALIGATEEQANAVCDQARAANVLVCANFNAPGQIVLSGHKSACERAAKVAEGMGLRSAALPVAGAFHSPLMAQAAARLGEALAKAPIKEPRCPVISNVTAEPHAASSVSPISDTIRRRLVEQLTSPVRWAQSCQWLAGKATGEFLELAPGKTLAGLYRRISKDVKVVTNDTP
ncbi:[acyl-carrier-protein] S-malonyltransferase [Phycisphaerales bacterium]|nr:[acyl-carrier-protein] S-malonyltransferase [Phycisphaerales bacterium]